MRKSSTAGIWRTLWGEDMAYSLLPYDPDKHTDLIHAWLDEDARRNTGIDSGADWNEDIAYWQKESHETFHAYLIGNPSPVAVVYCFTEPDKLHIGELLVAPEHRGKGIGTSILKYLLYQHTHCETATAVIFPNNTASIRAFQKSGFVHTSTHPDGDAAYYTFHRMKVTAAAIGQLEPWMYGKENPYRFVVIFAKYRDKWLYTRHTERRTWETAGGHIEPGETPLDAAKRELYEETGALQFQIRPLFDYHADNSSAKPGDYAAGQVFLAEIETFGPMPEYEMAETSLWDSHPPIDELTYPAILPILFRKIQDNL